jgi:DNA-binding IclR family transcriptional regulator
VRTDGRAFNLTPRVLELGYSYLASVPLAELAQPVVKTVVEELGESCSLAVLDDEDIVYIGVRSARRAAHGHSRKVPFRRTHQAVHAIYCDSAKAAQRAA